MYCPDCGHNNPENNRFCGMCGERLPERRSNKNSSASKDISAANAETPRTAERHAERRERIADHDPEPVAASLRHREPIDEPVRELPGIGLSPNRVSSEKPASISRYDSEIRIPTSSQPPDPPAPLYAASPHLESASPIEQPATTLSGPSFLGLSSGSNGSDSYSYLYEDEAPKSHAGFLAFLLLLVAAGVVVYWQWQPIQNWVLTRANQKVDTGTPAPPAPTAGSSTASSDNTATPPAQSQTPPPTANPSGDNSAATPATNTPTQQPNATPNNSATPKNAQPTDKPKSDDNASPDDQDEAKAVEPASKSSAHKATVDARTSAARKRTEPEAPAGAALVDSGEKYLYGRGVPQNCKQAVIDFNAAANEENPRAMAHLGAMYATGACVPLNRVQAYQWFSRALTKDRSNTYLEHNMSMLWREMDTNEKAQVSGKSTTEQSRMF